MCTLGWLDAFEKRKSKRNTDIQSTMNESLKALREYVTAPGSQNQADTTVRMLVKHSSLKARFMEIRLDKHVRLDSDLQCLSNLCVFGVAGESWMRCVTVE